MRITGFVFRLENTSTTPPPAETTARLACGHLVTVKLESAAVAAMSVECRRCGA